MNNGERNEDEEKLKNVLWFRCVASSQNNRTKNRQV